jgi:hypothetical protein
MFRPFEGYIYYSTVMPAHTTTPHYMDGDRHTALEHPSITQFNKNVFISIVYFNINFETHT